MPLKMVDVAAAVSSGLSIICATCERYWETREQGADRCLISGTCGSPMAGDVFSQYKGPITQFDKMCFVCGNESTHALRVKGLIRVIGCCEKHLDLVKEMAPNNAEPVKIVVIAPGEKLPDDLPKKPMTIKLVS